MKRLRIMPILALLGAALGGGCSDYDDDIQSLNDRVDELAGTVALKADASAVTALQQKFDGIDFSKFATKDALTAAIDGLKSTYVTKSDLNSQLAKYASKDDLKKAQDQIDAIIRDYAKKTDVDKVQAALDAYKQSVDAVLSGLDGKSVAEYVAAQMALLNGRIATVEDGISIVNVNIDNINNRIEALEGVEFVSPDDLKKAVSDLEEAIAACVKPEDLSKIIKEDENIKAWVDEAVKAHITAAINDEIGKAIDAKIDTAGISIKQDILNMVGTQFGTYMSQYVETGDLTKLLGVTSGDVLTQMQNSESEFAKAIIKLVNDNMGEDLNTANVAINAINEQLKKHEERLNGLDEAVSALKGRIQAIVTVPTSSNGGTYINGNYYLRVDGRQQKLLSKEDKVAVLTYRVAPVAKVAQIVKAYNEKDPNWTFSILDEETRAEQTKITIIGMEEVDGKLAVKVTVPDDGKEYALALQVDYTTVIKEGEEVKEIDNATAISDFTCLEKRNIYCEIQPGTFEEDGTFTKASNGSVTHELEYTSKESVSVKMDYAVFQYSWGDVVDWMTIEEFNKMINEVKGSKEDVLSVDYAVEPQFENEKVFVYDEKKMEVTLGKEANLNIGSTLPFDATGTVKLNGKKFGDVTNNIYVTIVGENGGDIIVEDMTMPWHYNNANYWINFDIAPYNNVFTTDYKATEGNPTLAEILKGTWISSEIKNAKDEVVNAQISLVDAEGGLKITSIWNFDRKFWGNTYTYENVYRYETEGKQIDFHVKGKITFGAKPTLPHGNNPATIETVITNSTDIVTVPVDWDRIMYNVEGFDVRDYGDMWNFINHIKVKSVKKFLNGKEKKDLISGPVPVENGHDNKNSYINFDPKDVDKNKDCIKIEVEYVYVDGEVETPIAEVTAIATVKIDGYAIASNGTYVTPDNKVVLKANLGDDKLFAWEQVNLDNYFTYTHPEGATETVEYSVKDVKGKKVAELTADNKLDFTNANTRTANVHAEVKVNGFVVAEHDIEVTAEKLFLELSVKNDEQTFVNGKSNKFDLGTLVDVFNTIDGKKDKNGKSMDCYDAKNHVVTKIPGASVTFKIAKGDYNDYFTLGEDGYTITFSKPDNAELQNDVTVNVTATYEDQFGVEDKTAQVKTITLTIKK